MSESSRSIGRRNFIAGLAGLALPDQLTSLLARFEVPGACISLLREGKVAQTTAYGIKSRESEERVHSDTIFEAGSLSQPVFAYAVLWMAQRGEIDLDRPLIDDARLSEILPDARLRQITARMVLSQSTGLKRRADGMWTLAAPPGSAYVFCSIGYVWLQRVIEKKSGQSLADFMRDRVIAPFRMTNSSFIWRPHFSAQAAEGHDSSGAVVHTPQSDFPAAAPAAKPAAGALPIPNAAAGMFTTSADYAGFLARVLGNPPGDMLAPRIRIDDRLAWGLGWGIQRSAEGEGFWHWCNNGVYQGFALAVPATRRGLVILTNSANGLRFSREAAAILMNGDQPAFSLPMPEPE